MIATRIQAVPLAKTRRVMIMLRISGVLSILLTRRTKDNTVNKSKATDPVRIKEVIKETNIPTTKTIRKLLKSIITSKYSSSTYKLKPLSKHNSQL